MKHVLLAVLLFTGLTAGFRVRAADDPLDAAKSLYLSASYEEALSALSNLPSTVDPDQADKFRALCFLALNRTQDAEHALERLATRRPLLQFDDAESPKLITMFREARARVLPAAAKSMYGAAKTSFEQGQLTKAASQFGELLTLLAEKDVASQPGLGDLKLLADGFSKLTEQQIASERAAAAAAQAAAAAPPVEKPAEEPSRIFTSEDAEVSPPTPVDQAIPQWVPPTTNLRYQEFSGVLEVVIDETGSVTSAAMAQRVNIIYDQILLSATKHWRYRPAQRNGKPVKYRKLINVVLRPAPPGSELPPQ